MKKPRSVYIAFEVFPRAKGSTSHIASMLAALVKCHAPVLFLGCGFGDMPARQEEGGVELRRFKVHHPNVLKRAEEFMDFVFAELNALDASVEVVVFRDPWSGYPALKADLDAALIFELNALLSWEWPYTFPATANNYALLAKLKDLERFCLVNSDAVLTVSSVTKDALAALGIAREKIQTIPNSAAEFFFLADSANSPLRDCPAGRDFGYIGSLHVWQGVETLINAFALAAKDIAPAQLIIVSGERKPARKTLKKKIRRLGLEGRVLMPPPLNPEDLSALIAGLKFTVAPLAETARNTLQGACPVKIIESMAAGTPVVASDLKVCREIMTSGREGLLVPPDNPRALALGLKWMFDHPERVAEMASSARKKAAAVFSQRVIHSRLEEVFHWAATRRVL